MKSNLRSLIINFILICLLSPLLILFVWSLTSSWIYPKIIPNELSLRGIEYILNIDNIKLLLNSVLISLAVVILTIIMSIPASKAMALYDFKGKSIFEMIFLSPLIIPTISIAMGIHLSFIRLGLANTVIGVIIINTIPCFPYAIKIMTDTYKIIGNKYEIQASILGANKIDTIRYIIIPLILPGILGASSMCFIVSFSQYFLTLLIGGGNVITYPLIMFPYIQSGDRTISSLYSIVFIIISLIVVMLMEHTLNKYYIKYKE